MGDLLQGLVTFCGLVLLAGIALGFLDREGKMAPLLAKVTLFSSKISAMSLGAYVMYWTYTNSAGLLSLSIVGVYVACGAIIAASAKDLLGDSTLASSLAKVALHKAGKMQEQLAKQAAEITENQMEPSAKGSKGKK